MPVTLRGTTLRNTTYMSQWTPQQLFSSGEQGVWYDPSDMSTMFQDSSGTIPVTGYEQPVGLMLDKSKGLTLGSELVTNGGFDSSSNWLLDQGTISGGKLNIASGSAFAQIGYQALSNIANKWYKVSLTVTNLTSGFFYIGLSNSYGGAINAGYGIASNGTYNVILYAQTGANLIAMVCGGSGCTCSIDNISVKEFNGNHAFQTTTASRPVLSARYNLLTYTEQFDNAIWFKNNATVTPNDAIAPNGTLTADKHVTTASATSYISQVFPAVTTGTRITSSRYVKAGSLSFCTLGAWGLPDAHFDLINLTYSFIGTGAVSASIQDVGNGWRYISATWIWGTGTDYRIVYALATSLISQAGMTVGDYIYTWGADLRIANDGVGLPNYQRVGAATYGSSSTAGTADYDTAGFPPYLKFDGVDDSLSTASINFTGTDKVTLFSAVRKLSDSPNGIVIEFSSTFANPGTFALQAPWDYGSQYRFVSGGNFAVGIALPTNPSNAPVTNVLTALGDISGDRATLRIDGSQAAQDTSDQNTGNYGNYPLYIGRRNNASLAFNGRLYQLIIIGALEGSGEINNTETWINNKTRAY